MIRIVHDNAQGRIEGTADIVRRVRPLVAYREQDLPPIPVQHIINGFMARKRRWGMREDHERLFSHPETRRRLADLGWGAERLTPRRFEAVMRMAGVWDGWTTLISPGGYFGAGLVPHVRRAVELRLGMAVEVVDTRTRPAAQPMDVAPPDLFDFQQEAIDAWFAGGCRGVVDLPPRSGKTHIAINMAIRLGLPTLIVVPTKELVRQTATRFRDHLHPNDVVEVTGGRPNAKKQRRMNHALVWVATPPTAAGPKPKGKGRNQPRPGMQGILSRKVLVIDEFHHSAADTWQDISMASKEAFYRLGLTGTHFRADGKDLAMHAVLSRCVYQRTVEDMVTLGRLVPARIAMVRVLGSTPNVSGHELYAEGIVDHPYRNGLIQVAAQWLMHHGKRCLVLTKHIRHAEQLADMIGPGAVQVDGRDNTVIRGHLNDLAAGKIGCVVGTSVIGEGVDVPAADALIYAAGGRSPVKHKQDYFRVLTASPGKTHGIIIDFADIHDAKLEETAAHRLGMYRSEGAFTCDVIHPDHLPDWIRRAV